MRKSQESLREKLSDLLLFFLKQKREPLLIPFLSGWQDSNLRPPAPKAGAITELRYTPRCQEQCHLKMAEKGGFEPPVRFHVRMFSKHVVSATHPSLQRFQ